MSFNLPKILQTFQMVSSTDKSGTTDRQPQPLPSTNPQTGAKERGLCIGNITLDKEYMKKSNKPSEREK